MSVSSKCVTVRAAGDAGGLWSLTLSQASLWHLGSNSSCSYSKRTKQTIHSPQLLTQKFPSPTCRGGSILPTLETFDTGDKPAENFEALELLDGICANNGTKRIYPEVDHDESNALVFI